MLFLYFCVGFEGFSFSFSFFFFTAIIFFLSYVYFERVEEDVELTLSVARDDGDM